MRQVPAFHGGLSFALRRVGDVVPPGIRRGGEKVGDELCRDVAVRLCVLPLDDALSAAGFEPAFQQSKCSPDGHSPTKEQLLVKVSDKRIRRDG